MNERRHRVLWLIERFSGHGCLALLTLGAIALSGCRQGGQDAELSPLKDVDFGKVLIGTTAYSVVAWKNAGGKSAEMDGAGTSDAGFAVVGTFPTTTVKVGATSPKVSVSFSPTEEKDYSGTVTPFDGLTNPPDITGAGLKGSGVARLADGNLSLADGPSGADAGKLVAKTALDFGEVLVGKSKDLVLTLKNGDLTKDVVVDVSWADGRQGFKVSKPGGPQFTVPKNGSVPVTITFTPADAKTYSDGVTFSDKVTNRAGTAVTGKGKKG